MYGAVLLSTLSSMPAICANPAKRFPDNNMRYSRSERGLVRPGCRCTTHLKSCNSPTKREWVQDNVRAALQPEELAPREGAQEAHPAPKVPRLPGKRRRRVVRIARGVHRVKSGTSTGLSLFGRVNGRTEPPPESRVPQELPGITEEEDMREGVRRQDTGQHGVESRVHFHEGLGADVQPRPVCRGRRTLLPPFPSQRSTAAAATATATFTGRRRAELRRAVITLVLSWFSRGSFH